MAINPNVNTAHVANKAAQVGFAQNVAAPKETKRTEEPRRVQDIDEKGTAASGLVRNGVEQSELESSAGLRRQQENRDHRVGRRQVSQQQFQTSSRTSESTSRVQTSPEHTEQQAPATRGDAGSRLLQSLGNSNRAQIQFNAARAAEQQQPLQLGQEAQRRVMLRNLEGMVRTQLSQYTGNEPYTRANYRQILDALVTMQVPSSQSRGSGRSNGVGERRSEGEYRLKASQAEKVLAIFAPEPERSDEPLELVA
ncbi:MAG TPA: hypothetical protein VNO81_02175 [Candidatus Nitrosotenuis sp.]|nr:hypothetical protein [Candidatus Nitrosotenuis sp.]